MRIVTVMPSTRERLQAARSPLVRAMAFVWMFAYLGLVAALPVLDARLEASGTTAAHWEDVGGTSNCPPVHDPGTCQVCQQISTGGRPADAQAFESLGPAPKRSPVGALTRPPTRLAREGYSSRAPPVA